MAIRKTTSSLRTTVLFILAVIVCLVVIRWAWSNHHASNQAEDMLNRVQNRQDTIEARLGLVQARNELLETETGVQDFLIEKYAIKREGERVLVLVRNDNEEVITEESPQENFWEKMGRIFFQ